eukprot:UN25660
MTFGVNLVILCGGLHHIIPFPQRQSTRMPLVSTKHTVDVNPRPHPGWTKGTVRQMDLDVNDQLQSGQVQVLYSAYCPIMNKVREFHYWVHLDNPGEVAVASSKTLPPSLIKNMIDKRVKCRLLNKRQKTEQKNTIENLFDENTSTFWYPQDNISGPWIVELDLGALRPLCKIALYNNNLDEYVTRILVIDIQTNGTLVNDKILSKAQKQLVFLTGRARYIRVVILAMNGGKIPCLTRMDVYGMPQVTGPSIEGMLMTVHWNNCLMKNDRQLFTVPSSGSSSVHAFSVKTFINNKIDQVYYLLLTNILKEQVNDTIIDCIIEYVRDVQTSWCLGDCGCQFSLF